MYTPSAAQRNQVNHAWTRRTAQGDQGDRYNKLHRIGHEVAHELLLFTPESAEQTLALQKLEEMVMWAIAAIARNEEMRMVPLSREEQHSKRPISPLPTIAAIREINQKQCDEKSGTGSLP